MLNGKKVVLVDDDPGFRNELASFLYSLGCFSYPCSSISAFMEILGKEKPDLALVDKEIGYEDGFDIVHKVRHSDKFSSMPIIMITGMASEENKSDAINLGADDLLAKPLSLKELELRMIANLRRSASYSISDKVVAVGEITINLTKHSLRLGDQPVDLTQTEYKIVSELLLKKGQIVNREQIAQKFLSMRNTNSRTIDVHINSLRKKLGDLGGQIKTIRGRGYMFLSETSDG